MNFIENKFMQRALELANIRRGFCAPNPSVGAVIVREDKIIGEGFHWGPGAVHAEVNAIQQAGNLVSGADIYVTLEPCSHLQKRTPPCTQLLIKSGIKRVFYGFIDPNPKVSGQGEVQLLASGIECQLLPIRAIFEFYKSYTYWWRNHKPWVTAKLAITLDGKSGLKNGLPAAITGKACQRLTHEKRYYSDAILTTAHTVLADNPQLNVRLENTHVKKPVYIIDRFLALPLSIRLIQTSSMLTLFHGPQVLRQTIEEWEQRGVRCISVPEKNNLLEWDSILKALGADGIHDLWIEAGGRCYEILWHQHIAQCYWLYISPKILGKEGQNAFTQSIDFNKENLSLNWQVSSDHEMILEIAADLES